MLRVIVAALVGLVALAISGCGGGGGSGGGGVAINAPPIANAGVDQTVITGAVVTVNGGASSDPEGHAVTYAWQMTSKPAGSVAQLSSVTAQAPTFRADKDGAYTLSLMVSDGSLTAADTMIVTAATDAGDASAATNASLSVTLYGGGSGVMSWLDTFGAGASYRVERQNDAGGFDAVETVAGQGGVNAQIRWPRVSGVGVYRVIALSAGREIPLRITGGGTDLVVSGASGVITINVAEPLAGTVALSIDLAIPGAATTWFVDGVSIGAGSSVNWNTTSIPNGQHELTAYETVRPGVIQWFTRTVTTANSSLAVSATFTQDESRPPVDLRIDASATTAIAASITSLRASVDGGAEQTATLGACANSCQFTFHFPKLASGAHTALITASDTTGATRQFTLPMQIANAPVLVVTTPLDGAVVSGTMLIAGNYATDTGSPVTVTAFVGATQLMQTTAQSFSQTVTLPSTTGSATLTILARDVNNKTASVARTINISGSASLTPESLFTLPAGGQLVGAAGASQQFAIYRVTNAHNIYARNLGTDAVRAIVEGGNGALLGISGDYLLFRAADDTERVINLVTGVETTLANSSTVQNSDSAWVVIGGNAYALGTSPSCGNCVLRWAIAGGAFSDVPNSGGASSGLRAHGQLLTWYRAANDVLTIHDTTTGTSTDFSPPPGSVFVDETSTGGMVAASVISGAPTIFYQARQTGSATLTIYKAAGGGAPTALFTQQNTTNGTFRMVAVGTSVVFSRRGSQIEDVYGLTYVPGTAAGMVTPVSLDSSAAKWQSDQGVLFIPYYNGIVDAPSSKAKVWDAASGIASILNNTTFSGSGAFGPGFLVYYNAGSTWRYLIPSGTRVETIAGGPYTNMVAFGGYLYFQSGTGVYRKQYS